MTSAVLSDCSGGLVHTLDFAFFRCRAAPSSGYCAKNTGHRLELMLHLGAVGNQSTLQIVLVSLLFILIVFDLFFFIYHFFYIITYFAFILF